MDYITGIRRNKLDKYIKNSTSILEFGPYVRPTILPEDNKKYYVVDCMDEIKLREYAINIGDNAEAIVPTNLVIDPISLNVPMELVSKFDLLIANHVFEHLVDPFRWLQSWGETLKSGGLFILCIPDKKYSFDKFRTDTTLAHFISDYLKGGNLSLDEHLIDCALNYDSKSPNNQIELESRLNKDFISKSLDAYQPGLHVHVFQYEKFIEEVLKPFLKLSYLDFNIVEYGNLKNIGEFYVVLKKSVTSSIKVESRKIFRPASDSVFE